MRMSESSPLLCAPSICRVLSSVSTLMCFRTCAECSFCLQRKWLRAMPLTTSPAACTSLSMLQRIFPSLSFNGVEREVCLSRGLSRPAFFVFYEKNASEHMQIAFLTCSLHVFEKECQASREGMQSVGVSREKEIVLYMYFKTLLLLLVEIQQIHVWICFAGGRWH